MDMTLQDVGLSVRYARMELRLTQQEVAEYAGVTRVTVTRLENGTLDNISYQKLRDILNVLGLGMMVTNAGDLPTLEDIEAGLYEDAKNPSLGKRVRKKKRRAQ